MLVAHWIRIEIVIMIWLSWRPPIQISITVSIIWLSWRPPILLVDHRARLHCPSHTPKAVTYHEPAVMIRDRSLPWAYGNGSSAVQGPRCACPHSNPSWCKYSWFVCYVIYTNKERHIIAPRGLLGQYTVPTSLFPHRVMKRTLKSGI